MSRSSRWLSWLSRAWPVGAIAVILVIHWEILRWFPTHHVIINKVIATSLQVVGGLIILGAINDNLGLLEGRSISSLFLGWFKDFPLARKPVVIHASVASGFGLAGKATMRVTHPAVTVDERLAELERGLNEVRAFFLKKDEEVHERIAQVDARLSTALASSQSDIKQVSAKLEKVTVGGFKQQIFGVMLAVYGAVLSAFV